MNSPDHPPHTCVENMHYHLNLAHFGDTNMKYLEVTGNCSICGRKAQFRGPIGLNPNHATVAFDGSQAVLPYTFEDETYDGKAVGYSVSARGAN